MKIYYFIAYFAPDKAYCYDHEKNAFYPYHKKLYRVPLDYETALQEMQKARDLFPEKANNIFIDCY